MAPIKVPFSYDLATGPVEQDITNVAAGYGALTVRLDGLAAGDTVQQAAFTAEDTGAGTAVVKEISPAANDDGEISAVSLNSRQRDLSFAFTAADIATIAAGDYAYAVRVWVLRDAETRDREVLVGAIEARARVVTTEGVSAVATVTVTQETASGNVGATDQLTAVAKDVDGNTLAGITFTWTSSDTNVATVDASGLVTYVTPGIATITAKAHGAKDTCEVTSNSTGFTLAGSGDYPVADGAGGWAPEDPETRFYPRATVDAKDAAVTAAAAADATAKAAAAEASAKTYSDANLADSVAALTDWRDLSAAAEEELAVGTLAKIVFGSTARTIGLARLVGWACRLFGVHVLKDPKYGAVGDGTTNDRVAIQAAWDAAVAAGGGIVYGPPGTYAFTGDLDLTEVWFANAVKLLGAGRYATYFKPAYVNAAGSAFDCTGSSGLTFEGFSVIASGTHGQIFLLARKTGDATSGLHVFRDVIIRGNVTNAVLVMWGSEENRFYSSEFYAVVDKPAIASAVKISELGFTPASAFTTIGTGQGGAGMNGFYGCRFGNEQGAVTTSPLVDIRGALGWVFSNCYSAHAGSITYRIGSSTYPSNSALSYPSSVTFEGCSDEDAWSTPPIVKDSIYIAAPSATTTTLPVVKGLSGRNNMFFNITAADLAIVDSFHWEGGKYANSNTSPTGTKMSFYDLTNSRITPSKTERTMNYAVRHVSESVEWIGIDTGKVAVGSGSYLIRDSSGNTTFSGFAKSASPTGGIGYEGGAGGTVTQGTSATTAVTLNKVTGRVTTVSQTLAAGASAQFQVNNSAITSVDAPVIWIQAYTGNGEPEVQVRSVATGAFVIRVRNKHATDALNGPITVGFALLRGAIA